MATSSLTNTGNQPYTPARIDYLASYMQTQLPGLSHEAAVKWIRAEQGVNGNVLGVTYRDSTGQHLYQYSSQEAGIRAAVSLIKASNNYAGIRASLGKSVTEQLQAIAASPWNAPSHYRNGGTFGVSISGATKSITQAVTPTATLTSSPGVGTITDFQQRLSEIGVPNQPTHVFTHDEAVTIVSKLYHLNVAGNENNDTIKAAVGYWEGKTVAQAWNNGNPIDLSPINPVQGLLDSAAVAGDIAAFLFDVENWRYLGAVVIGVPIALLGFYLLAGVRTGGSNA